MVLSIDEAMAHGALRVHEGEHAAAAALVGAALDAAPPGSAGWLIPVDPLLKVHLHPAAWAATLAKLRAPAGIWLTPNGV